MACCMFAAFIVGHIVLMWRSIIARWFPARAAAKAVLPTASAWRPGMEMAVAAQPPQARRHMVPRLVGFALIAVSAGYFMVQAKAALDQADDVQSFAVLLAQNICRVSPKANQKPLPQIVAVQSKTPKE